MAKFADGQKVQYKAGVKIRRPTEWHGILTFVEYTDVPDSCLVRNEQGGEIHEYALTLEPATESLEESESISPSFSKAMQRHHDHYVRLQLEGKLINQDMGQYNLALQHERDGLVKPLEE